MKVLLHVCCAPCLLYTRAQLERKGHEVQGFFYNPNIHPFAEYNNRTRALEQLAGASALEVLYPEYRVQEFFHAINGREIAPERCCLCWQLRLKATAREAKARAMDAFTTTLLVSPYQDHEQLRALGEEAAKESGVEFYYEDFRPGFRTAHDEAKAKGIYCQKYCGCSYSEVERFSKKKQ
jgi:predicted adenine nucleotide alpha hydrolase (AANH) superfamily ATPase